MNCFNFVIVHCLFIYNDNLLLLCLLIRRNVLDIILIPSYNSLLYSDIFYPLLSYTTTSTTSCLLYLSIFVNISHPCILSPGLLQPHAHPNYHSALSYLNYSCLVYLSYSSPHPRLFISRILMSMSMSMSTCQYPQSLLTR